MKRIRTHPSWPQITLYGNLHMRPFRNLWMLEEIRYPYTHVTCQPWSRVAKLVHPQGKVPALLVENWYHINVSCNQADSEATENKPFVILESAAINTFLGDVAREVRNQSPNNAMPMMLVPPPATPQRAKYDMLSMFVMTEIDSQSLWIERKHGQLSDVFGSAPVAVLEAKRQFDNALNVMVREIITGNDCHCNNPAITTEQGQYLLSTGFSAIDILFAHCCFWAQQIGWLDKKVSVDVLSTSTKAHTIHQDHKNTAHIVPTPLVPELAAYLERCRSRPAYLRANELRKRQINDGEIRAKL